MPGRRCAAQATSPPEGARAAAAPAKPVIVVEIVVAIAGFAVMVLASQRAVTDASELAVGAQVSPFIIGFTLLGIGTDLPEMANSVAASLSDHGDVNVGDSVGSAATQVTLVLGILGITLGPLELPHKTIARAGTLTVLALGVLAVCLADGHLGRLDACLLLLFWVIATSYMYRHSARHHQLTLPEAGAPRGPLVVRVLASFAVLAGAATATLWAVVALAERFDAPEFLVGFFLASLGTSLPELVFDVTAIRRGSVALAIGDVVGSSLIDASASVAVGPLIAPTDVTRDLVVRGTVVALVAIAFVTFVLSRAKEHDWRTGVILLFTYASFFVFVA